MRFSDPVVMMLAMNGLHNAQSAQAQAPPGKSPTDVPLARQEVGMMPMRGKPNVRMNPNTRAWTPVKKRGR